MSNTQNLFDSLPSIIEPLTVMNKPNDNIEVYNGEYILKSTNNEYTVDGKLLFRWLPDIGLRFHGKIKANINLHREYLSNTVHQIIINGNNVGECLILAIHDNLCSENTIAGITLEETVIGDKSIAVDKVHFEVVNIKMFTGDMVKNHNGSSFAKSRISLEDDKYLIRLDRRDEYSNLEEQLEENGGIVALYSGNLLKKKGSIFYNEVRSIEKCLYFFLSFINGRRISPVFFKGVADGNIIWEEYFSYKCSSYKNNITSWSIENNVSGFCNMWRCFHKFWRDENQKDCLITSVHWYIEANNSAGAIEGSIVMIQCALELLYNWIIVERNKMLKGEDAKNLHASNKIRLLLSTIGKDCDVPTELNNLKKYSVDKNQSAPEILVEIRNAIIHSQEDKRNKLSEVPELVIAETLQVSIWYVELILLNILEYKGEYFNRCTMKRENIK